MTKYRLVVGERGSEKGHIVETGAKTYRGALRRLKQELKQYNGDGWGRVEANYDYPSPYTWKTLYWLGDFR
jgi:hypothetical protein